MAQAIPQYSPPPGQPPTHPPHPFQGWPQGSLHELNIFHTPDSPVNLKVLAARGWLSLPLRTLSPDLYESYARLFTQSEKFFDSPMEDKMKYHIPANAQTSEEGFSVVEGEKSMITLRRQAKTPDVIKDAAVDVWKQTGDFLGEVMDNIALSLMLPKEIFRDMVRPCAALPEQEKVATLLRMFRYIRPTDIDDSNPTPNGVDPRVVAEPHRDLGMLSLVVGSSPGLEVAEPGAPNFNEEKWVSIEQPSGGSLASPGELTATLLSGATLARLTNNIYLPGRHRVLVHPASPDAPSPYRFSLVFALRADSPCRVSSDMFTTQVTGTFANQFPDISMGDIYQAISNTHFNINIDKQVREKQRQRLGNGNGNANGQPEVTVNANTADHSVSQTEKESVPIEQFVQSKPKEDDTKEKTKKWSIKNVFQKGVKGG